MAANRRELEVEQLVGSEGKPEQVGTEAYKQSVGSEVHIANHERNQGVGADVVIEKHEATEDDKIVISAECMTHVGRNDRWSRVAN